MASVAWALTSLIARIARSDNGSGCDGAPAARQLNDLTFVGQYLYRRGEYHEAYRLFTRLAEYLPHKRNDCTYYRIKCLLKLDRATQALQLTRLMLETDLDISPRWCLMASELYLRQHNIERAWACVSRGINAHQYHLDEDCSIWARIIQEKIARSKTTWEDTVAVIREYHWSDGDSNVTRLRHVDFVDILPFDLTTLIFGQLKLADRLLCTRVSKRWQAFITENTSLWQDMDFTDTPLPVELPSFLVYLSRLHGTPLKRLKIHHEHVNGEALIGSLVTSRCFGLHTLDLQDIICKPNTFYNLLTYIGPTLRVLRWNGLILRLGDILAHVAELCPGLAELDISYCLTSCMAAVEPPGFLESYGACLPKSLMEEAQNLTPLAIQILRLSSIHELTAYELAFILQRAPNIIQLNLEHCIVSFMPINNIIRQSCPLLERVTYHRHRHAKKQEAVTLEVPSHPMLRRNWREIRLKNTVDVSDTIFLDMVVQCKLENLIKLDLGGNAHLTDHALISLVKSTTSFPHLTDLSLADCKRLTEKGLAAFIAASANLEIINLAGLIAVTDYVLDMMPIAALHTVDLRRCGGMTTQGVMTFVDRRQDTLGNLYLSHDLVSPMALGYVCEK